jgi:hypothetical protein
MKKNVRRISEIVGFEIDLLHLNKTEKSKIVEQIDDFELRRRLKTIWLLILDYMTG